MAVNSHFFAPFPVPPLAASQSDYAYLIGLAASRGNVYSAFEAPFQNYALYTVTATATDLADNVRTVTATCAVAHDQGKR